MTTKKQKSKKMIYLIAGCVFLVLGITLVLVWWEDVVSLFRGLLGMVMAVGAMVLLYLGKE